MKYEMLLYLLNNINTEKKGSLMIHIHYEVVYFECQQNLFIQTKILIFNFII